MLVIFQSTATTCCTSSTSYSITFQVIIVLNRYRISTLSRIQIEMESMKSRLAVQKRSTRVHSSKILLFLDEENMIMVFGWRCY